MTHIYIIGSRGLPVGYSGYETFVLKLTEYSRNYDDIKYHVACRDEGKTGSEYNNAVRFYINTLPIGNAKAIPYDIAAFNYALTDIEKNGYKDSWIYILACRIGPFMGNLVRKAHRLGVRVAINPDGHEWMRGKWKGWIKKYWKLSERLMVKYMDLAICDSKEMERYIKDEYRMYNPQTKYLSYGADENVDYCTDEELDEWYMKFDIKRGQYYLIVGRFVPENNYEFIIREFLNSQTDKDLVVVTDYSSGRFQNALKETGFEKDKRIKFVGTLFDRPLLNRIRRECYIYLHGHEVGGTNPSLLEAMACGCFICAIDVPFTREVLDRNGLFFEKREGVLSNMISNMNIIDIEKTVKENGIKRISSHYNWETVALDYLKTWEHNK